MSGTFPALELGSRHSLKSKTKMTPIYEMGQYEDVA